MTLRKSQNAKIKQLICDKFGRDLYLLGVNALVLLLALAPMNIALTWKNAKRSDVYMKQVLSCPDSGDKTPSWRLLWCIGKFKHDKFHSPVKVGIFLVEI